MNKLRERWGLENNRQVIFVLLVFALTGTTVVKLKPFLQEITGLNLLDPKWLRSIIYFIAVLPIYQLFLLGYGFLFGLFSFFWEKEKRFYQKIKQKLGQR
ncbi:MAG: DUF6787 family protein [Bacteroidia bacterium]